MFLDKKDLKRIVKGATFLGSGGGGSKRAGKIFVKLIAKNKTKVELLQFPLPDDILDQQACIMCDIGSIQAFDEHQADALRYAFEALNSHFEPKLGKIKAFFPIETGPENTLAAFVMASITGYPVIDADGAGRAVPTIPLCSFSAIGNITHPNPVAIANGKGDFMLVTSHDVREFDRILRRVASTDVFNSSASLALWPDKVSVLAEKKAVKGTISRALHLGEFLEGIKKNDKTLIQNSKDRVNDIEAYLIGSGKISETPTKDDANAFQFTVVTLENELNDDKLTIIGQNESLIVFSDKSGPPMAIAPDSICYLTKDFIPLTNVEIQKDQLIYLIGIKASDRLDDPTIIKGFRRVLLELGYAGNHFEPNRTYEKLGDLLLRLA